MRALRWPQSRKEVNYMREKERQNKILSKKNKNENFAEKCIRKYIKVGISFTRQKRWGYRIFDFYSKTYGVAIEIDGKEHDYEYDSYRDEYNYRRSGIVVLRVRNKFIREDIKFYSKNIKKLKTRAKRKVEMGTAHYNRKGKYKQDVAIAEFVCSLPRDRDCLKKYLKENNMWIERENLEYKSRLNFSTDDIRKKFGLNKKNDIK